jgi:hypothetical protein
MRMRIRMMIKRRRNDEKGEGQLRVGLVIR